MRARDSLYLVGREKWLERQALPMHPFWPKLNGYGDDWSFSLANWMATFRPLLGNTDTELLGPMATFVPESEAIATWSDKVPVFGMWPKDRMPVIVYARGGAEAPSHRMEFFARQVSVPTWNAGEEYIGMGQSDPDLDYFTPVYNSDMHTLAQRFFTLFCGVWNEGDSYMEPTDILPVFNVNYNEHSVEALRMMRPASNTAEWNGKLWYPEHSSRVPDVTAALHSETPNWEFHSRLHFPPVDEASEVVVPVDTPDPKWRDSREVKHVYLGSTRDDYWVDTSKCPNCHQRLIIHADKAQCPTGTPTSLPVKCPECKGVFTWP
jgi:hypothetical protein